MQNYIHGAVGKIRLQEILIYLLVVGDIKLEWKDLTVGKVWNTITLLIRLDN
jgi:hypothetical protein